MCTLIVNSLSNGIRLDKYIFNNVKNMSFSYIIKNISNGKIKVNNKKQSPNYKVKENDEIIIELKIHNKEKEKKVNCDEHKKEDIDIKYEDDNIIIANKPSGLASHSDSINKDSMLTRIKRYCIENKESPELCNRLDLNTTGLMIFAKTKIAHTEMNKLIEKKQINKFYLCKVYGSFPQKNGLLKDWLTILDDKDGYGVSISNKEIVGKSVMIQTEFDTIEVDQKGNSILDINLLTGKKHQIRAHLAFYNHPIFGEQHYISKNKRIVNTHQQLYAYKLLFNIQDKENMFSYLNNKTIQLDKNQIIKALKNI